LFLVAIFLFSLDTVPDAPLVSSPWSGLMLFILTIVGFDRLCRYLYSRPSALTSSGYFWAEKRLSITALLFYGAGALYLCDAKYYLSILSFGDRLPALVNVGGLALFLLYLTLMWRAARRNYQHVFGRRYTAFGFILSNIKANLPIVLPWIVLSLCYDLLTLLPFHAVQVVLASGWGDMVFFGMFLIFVVLFFPPLVRRLWGCRPLPEGELKTSLQKFCKGQNFKAELYLWPLFEGKVLTAGVMGILPGLRYVLLTPAIIETMTMEELESVMAHEIGHVKRHHLLLYVFLIAGFSVLAGFLVEPFVLFVLSRDVFVQLITAKGVDPETVMAIIGGVPLLLFMVIYFRFIFGYFIRNFERQADLHVISAVGNGRELVSAFEKISIMSGDIRDEKNWHHYGIGERIDCLDLAEREPETIISHNKKVRFSLLGYLAVVVIVGVLAQKIPTEQFSKQYEEQYAEAVLFKKAAEEPDNALWQRLLGDMFLSRNMEDMALVAYEKAFSLEPANPVIMNNMAWLLLTSNNLSLRDPGKALTLARGAATLEPKGYILDTLATAYWANGLVEEAIRTEKEAAFVDPDQRRFYQSQAQRFQGESYEDSVLSQKKELQESGIE
jgi:Zn-dependent protease with chaperone function